MNSVVTRRSMILEANKSHCLLKYIETLLKKQREDPDYAKWDVTKPLPKLPVPDLKHTLEKYLRCLMPILSEEAYDRTEKIVGDFIADGGIGEKLQQVLIKESEIKENWVYDWWLEDMYLFNKLPLPINSNPGMIFPKENFNDEDDQLKFAARLISGIMDYKFVIDQKKIPVDRCSWREKGQPLCMEQYYRLFSSYRVPGIDKDKLVISNTNLLAEPEHVIVISRNQMFVLDVIVNFTRLSEDQLYHQLKRIKRLSEEDENTFSDVGFLTSLPRDEWAKARLELLRDSTNRDCIDMIERCIFIVCLDKKVNHNSNKENIMSNDTSELSTLQMRDYAFQMLHGCSSEDNSGNRWFDKTMQFVISEDGVCGLNYEHSTAEGIVVIQLSEHLFRYIEEKRKQKFYRMPSICELPVPRKLRWLISEPISVQIQEAKYSFDGRIDDLDLYVIKFEKFGRDFPKKIKTSPDSFIQVSLQFAYYRFLSS
ncbi:choline O-acetyltransferase [Brachionus plicatilis]|uniref:Choline O-acetyltransferase n=1 Tax=Brachionus plicatilis TaxID=10195 RepID=A0A3M7PR33_BRAPC|nr:choline O-acetyltransferase [Brachionus plicatilis]